MLVNVLVAFDGSPLSERALTYAIETFLDASVTSMYVINPIESVIEVEAGGLHCHKQSRSLGNRPCTPRECCRDSHPQSTNPGDDRQLNYPEQRSSTAGGFASCAIRQGHDDSPTTQTDDGRNGEIA